MESLRFLFRGTAETVTFKAFGPIHIFILLIAMLGCRYLLKKGKKNSKVEKLIGSILIFQQVTLFTWYISSNYNVLKEGLPLYHCRIAIWLLGIGFIFNKDTLKRIGSVWGLVGSLAALTYPCLDPFIFPHITQFTFFIGHLFLLWGSVYCLYVERIVINKSNYKTLLVFTNVYHVLMYILNQILGSNYGYMRISPIGIGNELPTMVYGVIVIGLFNIILKLMYDKFAVDEIEIEEIAAVRICA